jgi:hypothetical protein
MQIEEVITALRSPWQIEITAEPPRFRTAPESAADYDLVHRRNVKERENSL